MEGGEELSQANRFAKLFEGARKFFGRRIISSSEIPTGSQQPPEIPDWEAINRTFSTAEELVRSGDKSKSGEFILPIDQRGGIEVKAALELMVAQEKMELSNANVGDVAWWKDETDKTGYFLITKPFRSSPSFEYGKGVIKAELDNETVEGEATITGASFGGMLMMGRIVKNIPVEFVTEGETQAKYWTHPVETMGIIKAETVNNSNSTSS